MHSPCDCTVGDIGGVDGDYLQKGTSVFSLNATAGKPYVTAYFDVEAADKIPLGSTVAVRMVGGSEVYSGIVTRVEGISDDLVLNRQVRMTIKLDSLPPSSHLGQAVIVSKHTNIFESLFAFQVLSM